MDIVQLKEYIANTSILSINISKFSYQQKFILVILFKINKALKICFCYTVQLFCLAISLKIKSGKKFLQNTKKVVQG